MIGYVGASQITTAGPPVTSPPPASCDSPQDMVSGNMYVQDEYLGARHSHKPGREPKNGRSKLYTLLSPHHTNLWAIVGLRSSVFSYYEGPPKFQKKIQLKLLT